MVLRQSRRWQRIKPNLEAMQHVVSIIWLVYSPSSLQWSESMKVSVELFPRNKNHRYRRIFLSSNRHNQTFWIIPFVILLRFSGSLIWLYAVFQMLRTYSKVSHVKIKNPILNDQMFGHPQRPPTAGCSLKIATYQLIGEEVFPFLQRLFLCQ